jgi:hypothetical protein
MSLANATTRWYTPGSVWGEPITSAMLLTQMWLAKCSARKRSGRPVESISVHQPVDAVVVLALSQAALDQLSLSKQRSVLGRGVTLIGQGFS